MRTVRRDLLALDEQDLAAFANRGVVKRAKRELERGEPDGEICERADGGIEVHWSDGTHSKIPGGGTLAEGQCTSAGPAGGITRALIRLVLLYQKMATSSASSEPEEAPEDESELGAEVAGEAPGPGGATSVDIGGARVAESPGLEDGGRPAWDPGLISDESLELLWSPTTLKREREASEREEAVELVLSAKPSARFFLRPCFVRFTVKGDPRYARCSCGREPCPSVARAVWAFREWAAKSKGSPKPTSGLFSRAGRAEKMDGELERLVVQSLNELWRLGLGGVQAPFLKALDRLAARVRLAGLIWPAEILSRLEDEITRYRERDARFDPSSPPRLMAELDIRLAALHHGRSPVPAVLIRGSGHDREIRLERGRLHGLGCEVKVEDRRGGVEMILYFQLADSGDAVALSRYFRDPDPGEGGGSGADFSDLAKISLQRGTDYASLAGGRSIASGLRVDAGRNLRLSRRKLEVHPPAWREIRDPIRAEGFEEIAGRLAGRPHRTLGPRRAGEDLFVCEIHGVEDVDFNASSQSLVATLVDGLGVEATLVHPFTDRGSAGFERLLASLENGAESLEALAGRFEWRRGHLSVRPTALWFRGEREEILMPWIAERGDQAAGEESETGELELGSSLSLGQEAPETLELFEPTSEALADLCRLGLSRTGKYEAQAWRDLERRWRAWGSSLFLKEISSLCAAFGEKETTPEAPQAARRLAVLLELMPGAGL